MKRNNRGMTLLEVLVALAIFALSAMAIVRSVGQHINTLTLMESKTFAAMVADNQMAKVVLQPKGLTRKQGKEEMANRTWYWTITPLKTQDGLIRAFEVTVSDTKKGAPIVSVRGYVPK
ncbi:type II secretion system minor pseudopilin GspI [Vibrio intestinalis]|uniref:type II secretion system minor pseudopilin GspI n=1 Tax=Vibrio intestinalis TaxID=2933291 RepID=UPI0021A55D47|nr:type II secretion system minor pseudopilin GspI [Vibrio intestinalis]